MHLKDTANFLQLQDLGLRDYHCGLRINAAPREHSSMTLTPRSLFIRSPQW
jgi:hypothetical protein